MESDDAGPHDLSIRVDGGIHTGATGVLPPDRITILGAGEDSDLCLSDPGIAPHHAAIVATGATGAKGDTFVLRAMEGGCTVNGKTLRSGDSAPVGAGDRIALGDTGVVLRIAGQDANPEGKADGADACKRGRPASRFQMVCLSFVAFAVLTATAAGSRVLSGGTPAPELVTSVNGTVEALGLDDVSVSTEGEVVTIRGILSSEQYSALETALLDLPGEIVNRTQSVSLLLEQVSSVFRTNGYHAELEYAAGGVVHVGNLDGTNPLIQQVAVRVRNDVPALSSLEFLPVEDSERPPNRLAVYSTDPGKRLTTIIDGDTAYVATTDGGRYFVGSVLPGGLVLRQITAEGIQVDDNGEIHWLGL